MHAKKKSTQNKEAWINFFEKNLSDVMDVREEIIESWRRSKKFDINPMSINKLIASENKLSKKKAESKLLINIAKPYMENLYQFVKDSGFIVLLTNEEGFILESIVDKDIISQVKSSKLFPGAIRSEETSGTNAIGTCLYLNKPLQIIGGEHFYKEHHIWTCSAAPIHDLKGNIIGSLDISGPLENAHPHTLGMVVAAVDGIEKEIKLNNYLNEITIKKNQLENVIHANSDGIIFVNKDNQISLYNNKALSMFMVQEKDIAYKNVYGFFDNNKTIISLINNKQNIYDREITINSKGNNIYCNISALSVNNNKSGYEGILLIIKDSKHVHKLVNKMSGSEAQFTFDSIIGSSKSLNECKRIAKLAAKTNSNIILLGESGTGKELFAQSIHNYSDRSNGPFIAINCGALPRGLIESELFGYEGGTFTGSKKEGRPGKFELADGGTIFLDEIGDTPLDVQVTLLRVLQNKEVIRIGGSKAKKIDVRVISATNKDLFEEIKMNSFRTDLFYRLNVFSITIPPLRERIEDIKNLINHFIKKYALQSGNHIYEADTQSLKILTEYSWPGNVRELENIIERGVYTASNSTISVYDIPKYLINNFYDSNEFNENSIKNTSVTEKETIINYLKDNNGIIVKTAEALSMNRRTLYRKMEKYNINYKKFRN